MKELMSRVKSFIIFDSPLRTDHIRELFTVTHTNFQREFPNWSLNATRKKVIAEFWFRQVLFHFAIILAIAVIAVLPFEGRRSWGVSIFMAGSVSFMILAIINYWPAFYSDFLPKLDTIQSEQEKLNEAANEIKKCKRTQYSIPTLTIIFNVISKACSIPVLASNDRSAELLNHLFGADKDKLKENLSRLYKISHLSPKEKAEFQKGIINARGFFDGLGCVASGQILDQLEMKLQGG